MKTTYTVTFTRDTRGQTPKAPIGRRAGPDIIEVLLIAVIVGLAFAVGSIIRVGF